VFRKIAVLSFAVAWAAFAYLLWPEGISDRQVSAISMADVLRLASIVSVALGILLTVWTWRG